MKVMRQRANGRRMLAHGPVWLLVELIVMRAWRFWAGQVVLRSPGRYDSRYTTWAPPVPEEARLSRAEGIPRSTWARRPGWHRQMVRAAAVAWLCTVLAWPFGAAVSGICVVAAATVAGALRARRRRAYGDLVAPWWEFVAAKVGHDAATDPLRWVSFPNRAVTWEPVTPLVRLTGEHAWLTRRMPALAQWLARWATPIAEQDWVTSVRGRATQAEATRGARVAGRVTDGVVRLVEASRSVRVWPQVTTNSLDHEDARIEVSYPARYPAHEQDIDYIKNVVCARLPGEWDMSNRKQDLCLEFRHPRRMPGSVLVTKSDFTVGDPMNPIIGKGMNGFVSIPLKSKTPHVSVAASTGWGKTTTANVLAAQLLYSGFRGVIIDPKRMGFVGAFRNASENIEIRTTLEGQIEAVWQIREEMNRRYEFIENHMDRTDELSLPSMRDNPEDYFEPLFLLEDEKGSLTVAIKAWWKREGGGFKEDGTPIPGKGDPEPLMWMQEILWRGRQAAIHYITLAQQNNLNVFLNSDMRDQYMFRILSGPQTQSSWIMTFPGTKRRKVPSKKGRAVYGIGPEEQHEVQLAAISDSDARECAEAGVAVSEKANTERAERLAQVLGVPAGAVSPRPLWVDGPAEIDAAVPGQGHRGDAPSPSASRPLTLVSNVAEESAGERDESDSNAINELHVNALSGDDEPVDDLAAESSNEGSNNAGPVDPELIVGAAAAAAFLEIKEDTFTQRRKRMRRDGKEIPGETNVGRAKAWPRIELREWDNLYSDSSEKEPASA